MEQAPHITLLLEKAGGGDVHAASELLPLIYEELRRLASSNMAGEGHGGAGHTLQPTALVHEAYLRLLGPSGAEADWNGRGHFFAAAAIAMRRILIDRARARRSVKRGGELSRVLLHDNVSAAAPLDSQDADELLLLDEALTKLEALDERKSRVVMLRYYAGLSVEQTAAALSVSAATVKNDWAFAKAWLNRALSEGRGGRVGGSQLPG